MTSVDCVDSLEEVAHLETPCLLLKSLETFHAGRDLLEVLLHLLAKAEVKARKVCESRYAEIKVQNVVLVARQHFTQQGCLFTWVKAWLMEIVIFSHLSDRASPEENSERGLALQSAFDCEHLRLAREKSGQSGERVLRAQL